VSRGAAPLIRAARPEDCAEINAMIRELAVFERLVERHVATTADLFAALFGPHPAAEALIAEVDGEVAAFALFFPTFSTFVGKPGLWLEDLYVRLPHRRRGLGRALLARVAALACDRGCARLEWSVLDWNERAIALYRAMGAVAMGEWTTMRLSGDALAAAALTTSGGPAPGR
jgi:GNAT superfamily N-acetyltransferase